MSDLVRVFGRRLSHRLRTLPNVHRDVAEAMIAVQRHRFVELVREELLPQ